MNGRPTARQAWPREQPVRRVLPAWLRWHYRPAARGLPVWPELREPASPAGRRGSDRGCARHAANRHIATQILQSGRADARDVLQVTDRFEGAVFLAVIDDGLGLGRADALEAIQFLLLRRIDVDLGQGHADP